MEWPSCSTDRSSCRSTTDGGTPARAARRRYWRRLPSTGRGAASYSGSSARLSLSSRSRSRCHCHRHPSSDGNLRKRGWRRGGSRDGRGAILRGRLRLAARTLAVSDALICRWSACNSITGRQGESTRGRRGRARGRRARRGAAGAFLHLLRLLGACRVGEELLSRSRRGATESPRKARIHNGTVAKGHGEHSRRRILNG